MKGGIYIRKSILIGLIVLSIHSPGFCSSINLENHADISQDLPKLVNVAKVVTARQIAAGKNPDFLKNLEGIGKIYFQQMLLGNLKQSWMTGCNDFVPGGFCSGSANSSTNSWLDAILNGSSTVDIDDRVNISTNEIPASSGVNIVGGGTGTGNTPGGDIIGDIINGSGTIGNTSGGGIINGGGSISNGGWDMGSGDLPTGNGNDGLGSLASLFTGRQLSMNASYSVQCTHPQFVQGFASIDPENPLKHDNVTTKAWVTALTLPPTARVTWDSPPAINESKVYDTATPVGSVEEKKYAFAYTYQPPCDSQGRYPAPQKGVCTVTLRFKVSEFNALGGTGTTYNNVDGGSGASSGGFGMISSPTIVSGGNSNQGGNSGGGIVAPSLPKSDISSLTGALNDLMNGGIPYPFGSMTSPSVNVNIPGIGNGLMSLSSTINGLLKDLMPHPSSSNKNSNGNDQQPLPDGPMPTPDEVRQEHINDMSGIVNTAQEILKSRGVIIQNPEDVKKLYDPDSPYTDPKEAWDFNRLTQFIK